MANPRFLNGNRALVWSNMGQFSASSHYKIRRESRGGFESFDVELHIPLLALTSPKNRPSTGI